MEDTIIALSTATPAAVAVLRLSGPRAKEMVNQLFSPGSGKAFLEEPSRKLVYGSLKGKQGQVIDQVLATYSNGPHSYTGEDTAEVHCHGSPMVLTLALEAFFALGCRQAEAGEFTQRSFLQGKLDLTQAEAVADLLEAKSAAAVEQAVGQLQGRLSQRIQEIYGNLAYLMAHFCAVLDYPDEEIDPFDQETIRTTVTEQKRALALLEASWERGRQLTKGIPCALVGAPNAGKSSLLNALLGYERAIVTEIPGTTRDTVEGEIALKSGSLRLIDTAGVHDTQDPIEQMGVERSRLAMEEAELILFVVDASQAWQEELREILPTGDVPVVLVLNKGDMPGKIAPDQLDFPYVCQISAKEQEGLENLLSVIDGIFHTNSNPSQEVLLTNLRQVNQIRLARSHVEGALEGLDLGLPADAVLTDVEGAMNELGVLTGKNVPEDVTQEIFTRFCVGK